MVVKWIPIEKIEPFIGYEAFSISSLLILLAFCFYKLFLKKISEKRHGQLRTRFMDSLIFMLVSAAFSGAYEFIAWENSSITLIQKIANYLGLFALLSGAVAVIKIAQIYVYLYLFFSNISTGVPRLIGNLFTFVFSIFLFGLIASSIFNLNIAALAATSAVFSLVLGLALQDTLGNFFSGLALQIDRPFQINDWIEIQDGDQKWLGQIQEINWRATFLLTFSDEMIVFPNRAIAQSKITILGSQLKPVRLNHVFRFPFETPIEQAKEALLEGVHGSPQIMKIPGPTVLITETNESWITFKVFYSIHEYGTRYRVGDLVFKNILASLRRHQLKLAHQVLQIEKSYDQGSDC